MTKLFFIILSTFLISNIAWSQPTAQQIEINSLPRAVLAIHAMNAPPQTNVIAATPYSHESEKNNSLARAALEKNGTKVNLRINSASVITYSRYSTISERYNSLSRGALAK